MSAGRGASASKTVLGRGLLYTVGTAAPVLSNAVITPFVTRLLGPEDYGVVATALVVIQVGMIVAGLGLAAAITRHGILEESGVEGARSLVHRGAVAAVLVAACASLAVEPFGRLVGIDDDVALILSFAAAAGFSVVVNVQSYLRVLDRPLPFVLLSLGAALGGPALGLLVLLLGDGTANAYLAGLAAGFVLTAIAGLALTLRRSRHVRGDTRRALRVGLPTIPHQVALYLAGGALVLVAGHLYGTADAGRLQLAVLIGSAPGVLTASLNNAWAPVVYRTDPQHRGEVLEHTGRDIAVLTGLAAGFVAFTAPTLLRVAAPSTYDPTALTPAVGRRRDRDRAVGDLPLERAPRLRVRTQLRPGPGHPDGARRRGRRRVGGRERDRPRRDRRRDAGHLCRHGRWGGRSWPGASAPRAGGSHGSSRRCSSGAPCASSGAAFRRRVRGWSSGGSWRSRWPCSPCSSSGGC